LRLRVVGARILAWRFEATDRGQTGIANPAKVPADISARLSAELNAAIARPRVREQADRRGFALAGSTPAELGAFVRQQLEAWARGFRDAGMAPE